MIILMSILATASFMAGAPQVSNGGADKKGDKVAFQAGVDLWWVDLKGHASRDAVHFQPYWLWGGEYVTDAEGTGVSFGEDAGLDEAEVIPVFSVAFGLEIGEKQERMGLWGPEAMVRLSYWTHTWSGSAVQGSTEVFDGIIYQPGMTVESELQMHRGGVEVQFKWVDHPRREYALGLKGGLEIFHAVFDLEGPPGDESESYSGAAIGVGAWAEWYPAPSFRVSGGLAGYLGIPSIFDGSIRACWTVGPVLVEAGYRFTTFDYNGEDEELHASLQGPYLSAGVRF